MRPLTTEEISNPLARPEQLLIDHLSNMLNQLPRIWAIKQPRMKHIFDKRLTLEEKDYILRLVLFSCVIAHDFGKLTPAFQIKIKGVTLPRDERKYSFHIDTSAIFARLLFLAVLKKSNVELSNGKSQILATIVYYIVLMHHQKVLRNAPDDKFGTENISRVQTQFKQIFDTYNLEGIAKLYQLLLSQLSFPFSNYLSIESLKEVLLNIKDNLSNKDFFEDIIDDTQVMYYEMGANNPSDEVAMELFFIIEYNYSVLCDLDEWDAKFYLVNDENVSITFDDDRNVYSKEIVESYRTSKLPEWKNTIKEMTDARNITFELTNNIDFDDAIGKIKTLTAPTGSAKTLALINLGFKIRDAITKKMDIKPKIIYCLPFITITEQVAQVVTEIMGLSNIKKQSDELTVHHHLAPIFWNILEDPDKHKRIKRIERDLFFTKLWRSDVIITTFVRFWESILSCKKSEVLRFHRIVNSIIIFDEMQAIPTQFWGIIYQALKNLAANYNCTIISATATQPLIIPPEMKEDLVDTNSKAIELYSKLDRYDLFYHPEQLDINKFISEVIAQELVGGPSENLMIVLNTKRVSAYVREALFTIVNEHELPYEIYFLSRNVLAIDRKNILEKLQNQLKDKTAKKKCLLICTQLIEAGVDISFEKVYRDVAPLSSIIQVAGRCNRGMSQEKKGRVYIYNLIDEKRDKIYVYSRIYDQIEISKTKKLLANEEKRVSENSYYWDEVQLRELGKQYYEQIARAKNTRKCIKYLKGLQFYALNENFQLIKNIPEKTLFIIRDDEAKQIYQKIRIQLKKKKKVKNVPRKFYEYTLNISNRDRLRLGDKIESFPDEKEPIFWILRDDSIYNPKWGLSMQEK
ncbi:MAG: CRISPR-associated helicase Cas3' [Candidatus Heimdallarchaeota archaeon]